MRISRGKTNCSFKDELLISGAHDLRNTLNAAVHGERTMSKPSEVVIAFSRAMFEHASEYREVYHALLHTQGWSLFRRCLEEILDEIIRRECKAENLEVEKSGFGRTG
jgi:hypothetical protein